MDQFYSGYKTIQHYDAPFEARELTFSCYRGRAFLSKDRTRAYLADAIEQAREKHGIHVWAYVFMPEHVHLLIWPSTESVRMKHVLRSIKQSVARRAIRYLRCENPAGLALLATNNPRQPYRFWQRGPGYDRNITELRTLRYMVDYIHANPVHQVLRGFRQSPLQECLVNVVLVLANAQ